MSRFRGIAWGVLFAIAMLTVFMASLADVGLRLIARQLPSVNSVLQVMTGIDFGYLTVGFIVGMSAFSMLERNTNQNQVSVNLKNLWALVLCVAIALWVRSFIPIFGVFIAGVNTPLVVSSCCGIFWQSRSYWRWRR